MPRNASDILWAEAVSALARIDRLHRDFFRPDPKGWEPPVDVLETRDELVIMAALPGVRVDEVEIVVQRTASPLSAFGVLPPACSGPACIAWSCRTDGSSGGAPSRPAAMNSPGG